MKTALYRAILPATFVVAFVLATTAAAAAPPAAPPSRGIEGTWTVRLVHLDCSTGDELPLPPTLALTTFFAGGSVLSEPAVPAAALRTVHGVWSHAGGRDFGSTMKAFAFTPDGGLLLLTFERAIRLSQDGQKFVAADVVAARTPAGVVVDTRCAGASGERMQP